jgi:hypothetical protein
LVVTVPDRSVTGSFIDPDASTRIITLNCSVLYWAHCSVRVLTTAGSCGGWNGGGYLATKPGPAGALAASRPCGPRKPWFARAVVPSWPANQPVIRSASSFFSPSVPSLSASG